MVLSERVVQSMWQEAKTEMETAAEARARVCLKEWTTTRKTVETAIQESLSEHVELFEKATACRLLLEQRAQELLVRERALALASRRNSNSGGGGDWLDFYGQEAAEMETPLHGQREREEPPTAAEESVHQSASPLKKRRFVTPTKADPDAPALTATNSSSSSSS